MNRALNKGLVFSILLIAALMTINVGITYRNTRQLDADARMVAHTHEVLDAAGKVMLTLVDAETGQRGFLVTSEEQFLEPYHAALDRLGRHMAALKDLTSDNDSQQERIAELEHLTAARLGLLKRGIDLRRENAEQAKEFLVAGKGKEQMDSIRHLIADLEEEERGLLQIRKLQSESAYRVAVTAGLFGAILGLAAIGAFAYTLRQHLLARVRAAAVLYEQREWFRATLASIGDGVITTNVEGRVTFLNGVAQSLTGWKAKEAQGAPLQDVFQIVNENTRKPVENPAFRALKEGIVVGLGNHTLLLCKDGTARPIADSAAPIRDAKGKVSGVVLIFRDVTERRQAEEALEEAARRKDQFLATLAHELRNPLAPLHNALDILRLTGNREADFEELRDMMDRQVQQLVRLVDDLLDVARINRDQLELRRERLDLATVVRDAVETSRPLLEAAKHRLTVMLPSQPLHVEGDAIRLAQALSNLLNNAAKYTPDEGLIELTVEQDGKEAVLRVRDNGIGIPAEMQSRVFEMFAQGDRCNMRARGGLGIGLTLVRRLVTMHGGSIEVQSDGDGHGSTFTARLPLASDQSRLPDAALRDCEKVHVPANSARRILVVDDNEDSAQSLAQLLQRAGNEVRTANDGPRALEVAAGFVPDVVVLDIGLPGMTGYEVARRIREEPQLRHVVLVAQTGLSQEADLRHSEEAGFDHHLVKPVDLDTLQRLLTRTHAARA